MNYCSFHGTCTAPGECKCDDGWEAIDCSQEIITSETQSSSITTTQSSTGKPKDIGPVLVALAVFGGILIAIFLVIAVVGVIVVVTIVVLVIKNRPVNFEGPVEQKTDKDIGDIEL